MHNKGIIAGGSGFIGKNLHEYFSKNLLNYDIIDLSLRNPHWEELLKEPIDFIINLVGKAHDHKGTATKSEYFEVNVELTKQLFQQFLNSSAKLFIHISSLAAVEELESKIPIDENKDYTPISPYGLSKKAAEDWLMDQKLPEDKKMVIIRPPMVHGPGDKGNLRLLFNLFSKNIPYPLGKFENCRHFISISNFCYTIMEICKKGNGIENGIYHISDDDCLSTKTIAHEIALLQDKEFISLNIPKPIIVLLAKVGDFLPIPLNSNKLKKLTDNLLVSNEKIKRQLNIEYMPMSAIDGLRITLKSFLNEKNNAN